MSASAMRDLLEFELMEKYHWLPQDIEKIPYRTLQKINIIDKQRNSTIQTRTQLNQLKSQGQSVARGQRKRFYREV